jgi:hypothetical protein
MSTASSPVLASPIDDGSADADEPHTPPPPSATAVPAVVVYNPHTYAQLQAAAAIQATSHHGHHHHNNGAPDAGTHLASLPSLITLPSSLLAPPSYAPLPNGALPSAGSVSSGVPLSPPGGFMASRSGAVSSSLPMSPLQATPATVIPTPSKNGRPPLPPSSSAAIVTAGPIVPAPVAAQPRGQKRNSAHLAANGGGVKKEAKANANDSSKSDIIKLFEFWDNRTHDKASRETCHWCGTACDSSKRRFCSNEYCGSTNNTGKSRAMFICDKCIKLQKGFFGANFVNVFGPGIDDPTVPWYCLNCLIIADYNEV